ncbi:MAG: class I SAM-dependent methyltransferase [Methylococcaceae bacterium]|jgi:tRNA1(Val) A37 N6-methylase TrmN6
MPRISLPKQVQLLLSAQLQSGDTAIDATVGNGHDCLFLAQHIAPGQVYGFDIQTAALTSTLAKIPAELQPYVQLIQANHADMAAHIPKSAHGNINVIMFNLGYLPGGNKHLITQADTTLAALNSALMLLTQNGLLTVIAYPGHEGGNSETKAIECWCKTLDLSRLKLQIMDSDTDNPNAPRLFVIHKLT